MMRIAVRLTCSVHRAHQEMCRLLNLMKYNICGAGTDSQHGGRNWVLIAMACLCGCVLLAALLVKERRVYFQERKRTRSRNLTSGCALTLYVFRDPPETDLCAIVTYLLDPREVRR